MADGNPSPILLLVFFGLPILILLALLLLDGNPFLAIVAGVLLGFGVIFLNTGNNTPGAG